MKTNKNDDVKDGANTPQTGEKTGRIRQTNEQLILDAAINEFSQRGFRGASMQRIADEVGVPRTNVHYYFKNKEFLYREVLTHVVEMWNTGFDQIQADDDPAMALAGYIHAKLHYSKVEPLLSKIFANEIIHGAPHLAEYLHSQQRLWLQDKAATIQQWIDRGLMDAVDPMQLIFMIWSVTQHYADFSVQVCAAMETEQLVAEDFDNIYHTVSHIILKGCGLTPPANIESRT